VGGLNSAAEALPIGRERPLARPSGGKPRGRPKGARSKRALALEAILDGAAAELVRRAMAKALAGDGAALHFCLTRLLSAKRERPLKFDLPPIEVASDLVKASGAVLAACAAGTLTPSEAARFDSWES